MKRLWLLVGVASVLAVAVVAGAAGAKPVAGSKHRAPKEWGGTHSRWPGVRTIVLETVYRAGRRARYPAYIERWGVDIERFVGNEAANAVSCEDGSGVAYAIPSSLSRTHQGFVSFITDTPVNGPRIRVRKRRFSHRDSYDVREESHRAHVKYSFKGRFLSPRRVKGTVKLNVVKAYYDGRVTHCRSGRITWRACVGDLDPDAGGKRCLGKEPEAALSPTGELEPL